MSKERIMTGYEGYMEAVEKKKKMEEELREIGKAILVKRDLQLGDKYLELSRQVEKQDEEINYWARYTLNRMTEHIEDNQ